MFVRRYEYHSDRHVSLQRRPRVCSLGDHCHPRGRPLGNLHEYPRDSLGPNPLMCVDALCSLYCTGPVRLCCIHLLPCDLSLDQPCLL